MKRGFLESSYLTGLEKKCREFSVCYVVLGTLLLEVCTKNSVLSSHDNVGSKGREQNDKRCGLCFDVMLFRGVQEGDKRLHATPA